MCFDPRQLWSALQKLPIDRLEHVLARVMNNWISDRICALTHGNSEVPEATNRPFWAWFGAFWGGVANFKISKNSTLGQLYEPFWSILRRCGEFQEVTKSWKSPSPEIFENLCFFFPNFPTTSFCLFLVLNLPKKGPKTGNVDNVPKIFCFLLIPVLKCLKSGPFCQLFEVQFWTHAITSEGVVTIAPSVQ